MEIWQIVVICILMLPLFLIANYIVVKKAAAERRSRDDRIERAVSDSVAASYARQGAGPAELAQVQGGEEEEEGVIGLHSFAAHNNSPTIAAFYQCLFEVVI